MSPPLRMGDAEVARSQTVTLRSDGNQFAGMLDVAPESPAPSTGALVQLFIPGHGPAHARVIGSCQVDADLVRVVFQVEWMSPDLRAACTADENVAA